MRRNGETGIIGRYGMRRVELTPGAEYSATGVSLTALTKCVYSDGAIPPGWNYFLLMLYPLSYSSTVVTVKRKPITSPPS